MKGKKISVITITIVLVGLMIILILPNSSSFETLNNFKGEVKIYKSLNCGCCEIYSDYFKAKGNKNIKIINMNDISTIRDQYGVPSGLASCHTTIVGDYFVEGHIPLEAIEKLMGEKPDIAGIAMPGMPSGSPGMPGAKYNDFIIYAIDHDGGYSEFMRI